MCYFFGGWIKFIDLFLADVDKEQNTSLCVPVRAFTVLYGPSYWRHGGISTCIETAKQYSERRSEKLEGSHYIFK
jgi:hypothetical protein